MDYRERWRRALASHHSAEKKSIIREIEWDGGSSGLDSNVELLYAALDDADDSVRIAALRALARFAPNNPDVVTAVRSKVELGTYPVNIWSLAVFLQSAGPAAEYALPLLVLSFETLARKPAAVGSEPIWEALLQTVANIGPEAHDTIPWVIGCLHNATGRGVIEGAAAALAAIGGPAVQPMMEYVRHESSDNFARKEITEALGRMPAEVDVVIPFLIEELKGTNWFGAVFALASLGPLAKKALPSIESLPETELHKFYALWKIQRDPKTVLPKFIENLEGNDSRLRVMVALAEMGPEAHSAVPALRSLLFDDERSAPAGDALAEDIDTWGILAVALWRIEASQDVLPVIAAADWLVQNGQGCSRYDDQIVQCASEIRSWSPDAIAMRELLGGNRLEQLHAAKRLRNANPCVIRGLLLLLRCLAIRGNSGYRRIIANTMAILGAFGDKAAIAVWPLVWTMFPFEDVFLQKVRLRALRQVGRGNKLAATSVVRCTKHPDAAVRIAAVNSLGQIALGTQEIQDRLVEALHDPVPRIRAAAARSLGLLPIESSPTVVSALIEALEDQSRRVRAYAASSLGRLSPSATEAVPALRQLLTSGGMQGLEHVIHRAIESISGR